MALRTIAVLLIAGALWAGTGVPASTTNADSSATISGSGAATIDGVLEALEWNEAGSYDFRVNLPAADGGGTTTGTIFVMNDATDLYIALRIVRQFRSDGVFIHFDSNRNGDYTDEGEDYVGVSPSGMRPFIDGVYTSATTCPAGSRCGVFDAAVGGTSDGDWGARYDSTAQVYEMSHPLDSDDDTHDVSLAVGDTVTLYTFIRLWSLSPPCIEGPTCYADTYMSGPDYFGLDLVILPPPAPPAPTHDASLARGYNLAVGPLAEALDPQEFMACVPSDSWLSLYVWDAQAARWRHFSNNNIYPDYLNRAQLGGIQTIPRLSSVAILTSRAVPDARLKDGPGHC